MFGKSCCIATEKGLIVEQCCKSGLASLWSLILHPVLCWVRELRGPCSWFKSWRQGSGRAKIELGCFVLRFEREHWVELSYWKILTSSPLWARARGKSNTLQVKFRSKLLLPLRCKTYWPFISLLTREPHRNLICTFYSHLLLTFIWSLDNTYNLHKLLLDDHFVWSLNRSYATKEPLLQSLTAFSTKSILMQIIYFITRRETTSYLSGLPCKG